MALISRLFYPNILKLSNQIIKNLTLLYNKVEDNKVNKLINKIIKKLDPTTIIVKNHEFGNLNSNRTNKTDEISTQFKTVRNLFKTQNL